MRVAKLADEELCFLAGDYSGLEVGVQGDWCFRLFGDTQIVDMYLAQAKGADIHGGNAKEVFGRWLHFKVPTEMVDKKTKAVFVPEYAGQSVLDIPTPRFKDQKVKAEDGTETKVPGHPFAKTLRDNIKEVWYGFAYGKRGYGFQTLRDGDGKMMGEERATEMVEALMKAVPGTRLWSDWVEEYVLEHRGIYSLGGRWCPLYDLVFEGAPQWMIRKAVRRALNFPMQATGADIIGDAMVRVASCPVLRRLGYYIVLQIHDELVLIGPKKHFAKARKYLKKHMEAATANGTRLLFQLQVGVNDEPASSYIECK